MDRLHSGPHSLPKAILGRTALDVTRLGYGAAFRRRIAEGHADRLLNQVIDAGVNFVDTAGDYLGSEVRIGRALSHRYGEFHVSTKSGCTERRKPHHVNGSIHEWTSDNLYRGVEQSLQRLNRDSLEMVQLHSPTVEECEMGRLVETLADMRSAGLVRWTGISTELPHLPVFLKWDFFDYFQVPYSAVQREHEHWITQIDDAGAGVVVRGGVRPEVPARWAAFERAGLEELLEAGESASSFMLRFALSHPAVHTVIVGTTNVNHLLENVDAALAGPLPDDVYAEARRRLDAAGETPADLR